MDEKIKISAIVTTCNEDRRLNQCLSKLKLCDELVVIDLESKDESAEIAKKYATKLITHPKISPVEKVLEKFVPMLKNKWVLHIDPDEIIDEELIREAKKIITKNKNVAAIAVPWRFYFKGKKLNCSIWGGNKKFKKVFYNKNRVLFKNAIHKGYIIKDGEEINLKSKYGIKHYWMDSYKQLLEKHLRYIDAEGESRYKNGERYRFSNKFLKTAYALKQNLTTEKGILGGFKGIFLSFFYSWYIWESYNSLKKYEKKIK